MARKTVHKRRSARKMMGGSGAGDHAIAVYGGIGQQHAVGAGSNVIAENPVSGGSSTLNVAGATLGASSIQTGGSKKRGGNPVLVDLAVPAVLLYADQKMKSRSTAKRGLSRRASKRRFSRRRN